METRWGSLAFPPEAHGLHCPSPLPGCSKRAMPSESPKPLSAALTITRIHCPAGAAGDGAINEEDLTLILRQLAGSGLSDSEVANLVRRVFAATGASTDRGITFAEYRNALSGTHIELQVDVPAED